MNEYISKQAVIDNFRDYPFLTCDNMQKVISVIEATPTADVVKVVRCKDCKHYDIRNAKCLLHSENADQYSSGFNFEMYSKDFCSYGELKEGEKV